MSKATLLSKVMVKMTDLSGDGVDAYEDGNGEKDDEEHNHKDDDTVLVIVVLVISRMRIVLVVIWRQRAQQCEGILAVS